MTYIAQLIFDECHKAKNLVPVGSSKPTKTGRTVLELQNMLPKARVVYCSATGKNVGTVQGVKKNLYTFEMAAK